MPIDRRAAAGGTASRQGLSIAELRAAADASIADAPSGSALTPAERSLVEFGLAATTTALDTDAIRRHGANAVADGATIDQLVVVMLFVSALGMHSLHEGVRELRDICDSTDPDRLQEPLGEEQLALRSEFEGTSTYWQRLDEVLPGFLDGLLRFSPEGYRAFFEFCAVPWRADVLEPRLAELLYLAIDATPTHRYGPGFQLHLDNAIRLGATRQQLEETLALAADAPVHRGVRR